MFDAKIFVLYRITLSYRVYIISFLHRIFSLGKKQKPYQSSWLIFLVCLRSAIRPDAEVKTIH